MNYRIEFSYTSFDYIERKEKQQWIKSGTHIDCYPPVEAAARIIRKLARAREDYSLYRIVGTENSIYYYYAPNNDNWEL
jgi:hypothetical protein